MGLHLPTSPSTQDSTVVEEESPSKRTPKGDEVEWVLLKDTARGTFRRSTAELAISAPVSPIDALKVLPVAKEILTETWPGLSEDKIKMAVSFSPGNTNYYKNKGQLLLLRPFARRDAKAGSSRPQGMEAQTLPSLHLSRERAGLLV